jgi:hypothetical protein
MFPVLTELCRLIDYSNKLSARLNGFEMESYGSQEYRRVSANHTRVVETIMRLSTKLRLTPISRYEPNLAGAQARRHHAKPPLKPWETRGDDDGIAG